jgi:outer membrane protein
MSRFVLLIPVFVWAAHAEIRSMTLRQAVETALRQNPDIALARLDEHKAAQAVRVARDPFTPRIYVGSGLAYSTGFPMSIEGSAPSVVQARAVQDIFNRPQTYAVAQAKEEARGATLSVQGRRDEAAYRIVSLSMDAERAARIGALARKAAESLERVLETVRAQVREGRALPLAEKQAEYNLARARQTASGLEDDQATAETALAVALGFSAEDRVRPVGEERPAPAVPESEQQAIEAALESSTDLRRLESQSAAKQLEMRGVKAQRLPRADLVAQYAMMARFNNYDQFFRHFQRNNGQLGVSFQVPLFTGPGVGAQLAQTEVDLAKLRIDMAVTRNRLSSDVQQSFRELRKAESASTLARLDLEVAREQLSVNLAQLQEGRITLREVEQARIGENDRWIAFYDAQYTIERARWNLLRLTGTLLASIQSLPGAR